MSHTIGQVKQNNQQSNFNSSPDDHNSQESEAKTLKSVSSLADADYEFLFNQLLEGISHGWHDQRIIKFFNQLGDRGKPEDWVAWLERLRTKVLALPIQQKRQLGTIMIRLGELTRSATEVEQIGAASNRIGRELLFGNTEDVIWEYVGTDISPNAPGIETESEISDRLPADFLALSSLGLSSLELRSSAIEEKETTLSPLSPSAPLSPESMEDNNLALDLSQDLGSTEREVIEPGISLFNESGESGKEFEFELSESATEAIADRPADKPAAQPTDLDLSLESKQESTQESAELLADKAKATPKQEVLSQETLGQEQSNPAQKKNSQSPKSVEPNLAPDLLLIDEAKQNQNADNSIADNSMEDIEGVNIQQVISLIQKDQELAQQISQKLKASSGKLDKLTVEETPAIEVNDVDSSSMELIESWFNLGLKQVSTGEFAKAIASWEKALKINPNLSEAWHNRGSALGRLGKYDLAVTSFQNALTIDSQNYQAWNDRAHALYQLENWSEAVASWNNALKIMPANHRFWYNRGCGLEQLENWEEAITSYEKCLEIKPDFQPARSRYINLVADNSRPN